MMHILFVGLGISPKPYEYNSDYFSLGLRNLAIITEKCGIHTSLFDINESILSQPVNVGDFAFDISNRILSYKADIIGFYTSQEILPLVIECSKYIKESKPSTYIMLGGPGTFGIESEVLEISSDISLVCVGEGELTISEMFCDGYISKNLSEINGIVFRDDNGAIIRTPRREHIADLDTLCLPDFSRVNTRIEAGRGCPYNCSFCTTSNFWDRKYRVKTAKRLVMEMNGLANAKSKYRVDFIHDNLLASKEYILELCNELKLSKHSFQWSCSARTDNLDEHIISTISKSGCKEIFFGIEVGSTKMQRIINKKINIQHVYEILALCDKYGIKCTKSFIIGFPEETVNDLNETLEVAIKCSNFFNHGITQLTYLIPSPATAIASHPDKLREPPSYIHLLNDFHKIQTFTPFQKQLVTDNPKIFSSFFVFDTVVDGIDRYKLMYCFSHLLFCYPKSLKLLLDRNIRPIEFFCIIKDICPDCVSTAKILSGGGDGVCKKLSTIIELLIKPSLFEREIIQHEERRRNKIVEEIYHQYNLAARYYQV